jgi:hypothetical protein
VSGRHGMHLLNQDQGLRFGIAWFWTLPKVRDVQDDIDALAREFRALFPRTADSKDHAPLPTTMENPAAYCQAARVEESLAERNLAVHGVRTLSPDEVVLARVTRGRYRGTLQNLSLIRLRSLNEEVGQIIAVMESLLYSNGVIEGMTEASRHYFQN